MNARAAAPIAARVLEMLSAVPNDLDVTGFGVDDFDPRAGQIEGISLDVDQDQIECSWRRHLTPGAGFEPARVVSVKGTSRQASVVEVCLPPR